MYVRRKSLRLPHYDYSSEGAYFITLCTERRLPIFGSIKDGEMVLNEVGVIAQSEWLKSSVIRREIELDEFIVMPNHLHAIVFIVDPFVDSHGDVTAHGDAHPVSIHRGEPHPIHPNQTRLGSLISGFKRGSTKQINLLLNTPAVCRWQKNYYEHIVRNEKELYAIREYIRNNPLKWELDKENPTNL